MSIYEIRYVNSTPVSVTINEAVELAKKFGGEGDSAFINGILGTVARSGEDVPQKNAKSGKTEKAQ